MQHRTHSPSKNMLKSAHFNVHICDLLSENPTSLHNSVFEIFAIEIHGAKYVYYKNNFTHVVIALINSQTIMD